MTGPGHQKTHTPGTSVGLHIGESVITGEATDTCRACPGSPGYAGAHVSADVARPGQGGEVARAARCIRGGRQDSRRFDVLSPPFWPSNTAVAVVRHARTSSPRILLPDCKRRTFHAHIRRPENGAGKRRSDPGIAGSRPLRAQQWPKADCEGKSTTRRCQRELAMSSWYQRPLRLTVRRRSLKSTRTSPNRFV